MENSSPNDFEFQWLIDWFIINIRTFKHIKLNDESVEQDWIEEYKKQWEKRNKTLVPFKNDPRNFVRKGTGNGGR